jgi:hypothetical protein
MKKVGSATPSISIGTVMLSNGVPTHGRQGRLPYIRHLGGAVRDPACRLLKNAQIQGARSPEE